jgi:hypothetical protein
VELLLDKLSVEPAHIGELELAVGFIGGAL